MNIVNRKRIAILNYSEVTQDARVFKQARVLADAGHNVHVFCNQLGNREKNETISNIKIKRFRCFERSTLDREIVNKLPFLEYSGAEVTKRFDDYLEKKRQLERLQFCCAQSPLNKYYYKSARGTARMRRKLHHKVIRSLSKIGIGAPGVARQYELIAQLDREKKELAASWESLGAIRGLVFMQNLLPVLDDSTFDIVHAHDLLTLPAGVALAKRGNGKLIYDAHEYEAERAGLHTDVQELTKKLEDDCLKQTDHVITVSKGIAELYSKRFTKSKPTLIYNSPDIARSETNRGGNRLRDLLDLPEDVPLIAYIGGIQRENRGVDKLAAALVHLPGFHIANLGPRKEPNDAWIMGIAEELGVADRIHLLAPVPAEAVPYVVSDATLAASASQNIGLSYLHSMPNKLFEATFARLPVCVPDRPDQKEFVRVLGHGVAMDQTDPLAIAVAIKKVAENREAYKLTDNSLEILNKEYSWNAQAKRLLELYERLSVDRDFGTNGNLN